MLMSRKLSLLADIARLQRNVSSSSSSMSMQPLSLFTVVFAGEFNSRKSTLINALRLGEELLEAGVLPTTDAITILMSNDDELQELFNEKAVHRFGKCCHTYAIAFITHKEIPYIIRSVFN